MSDRPPQAQQPSNPYLAPVLTAVTYVAAVIAAFGFTSLILDRDVIDQSDAGPLLGPAMVASAFLVCFIAMVRMTRRPRITGRRLWVTAVATAALVYAAMVVTGALGYSYTRGDPLWFVLFAGHYAASPFVVIAAVLAGLTVVGYWLVRIDRQPHRG